MVPRVLPRRPNSRPPFDESLPDTSQSPPFAGLEGKSPAVASGAPRLDATKKTIQGDDLTAPFAIQRPAAIRTRNATLLGVQTAGILANKLPSNSASP
jgi:hypothetical protein